MGIEPMNLTLTKGALYQLSYEGIELSDQLGLDLKWAGQDSNLRRLTPGNLQSPPFAARDTDPFKLLTNQLLGY
jgi:hypothetical protein